MTWRQWLLRAVAGDPADLQIMYGLAGSAGSTNGRSTGCPGTRAPRPVRVGNAASTQLQLDVYGEVLDGALPDRAATAAPADDNAWALCRKLLEWLEDGWRQPDAGIWEVRGPLRHFTHSKVMAWVAFDRAVRAVEEWGREGPGRALARAARRDPRRRRWRTRGRRGTARLHAVLRLDGARRERAADAVGRLPARRRPAVRVHGRGRPSGS